MTIDAVLKSRAASYADTVDENQYQSMLYWIDEAEQRGYTWFTFLDTDEYLWCPKRPAAPPSTDASAVTEPFTLEPASDHEEESRDERREWTSIVDLLDEKCTPAVTEVDEIYVRWRLFGSSGHVEQPERIRESFTMSYLQRNSFVKTIKRVAARERVFPVTQALSHGVCDAPRRVRVKRWDDQLQCCGLPKWFRTMRGATRVGEYSALAINHYRVMSRARFFARKSVRSYGGINESRNSKFFATWDPPGQEPDTELAERTRFVREEATAKAGAPRLDEF
jgi:hypothetical protein